LKITDAPKMLILKRKNN